MTAAETLESCRIGFIGAGNMAGSLIRGLLSRGVPPSRIRAADIDAGKLQQLVAECGIVAADSPTVARESEVLLLAVKPQTMQAACQQLRPGLGNNTLVISIAAGITINQLQQWLGANVSLVRCMPNTPALVGKGASALYADASVPAANRTLAGAIMSAVGISVWVDQEALIDAVTAVSGSGPAYFFLLMECMQEKAVQLGLTPEAARQLVLQTALGAATLADAATVDVAELRRQVTSPGGTTEQAIRQFESGGLRQLVDQALQAACDRSRQLAAGAAK